MKLHKRIAIVISLLLLLITNFAYADENDKDLEVSKSAINNPKIIVVSSIDDIENVDVKPGDIIKVDEKSSKAYGGYSESDILATYEASGILFTSYSKAFSTEGSLIKLHEELLKNVNYKEIKKIGKVTIYPDGPTNTLGMALNTWNQISVSIDSQTKLIPYEYIGADIEIYQTEESYHDELSEILPTLSHEYGHVFTYNYMVEAHHQLPSDVISDYVKIRGIEGNSKLRTDYSNGHKWCVAEIMAEDYRIIFGTEENPAQHENVEIPNVLSEPYYSQVMEFWNETLIKNGDGTSSSPYLISSPYQLSQIEYYDGGHKDYKLTQDIDLNNYDADYIDNKGNWFPINSFSGILDGNDYNIKNLKLENLPNGDDLSYGDNYGFFRTLDGDVRNLGLINVNINGYDYVGSLTGSLLSNGTISNCYVDGFIKGNEKLGGLVGDKVAGSISNCNSKANIAGHGFIGGIVGRNSSTVKNCKSEANLSGNTMIGGIIGYSWGGTISKNYSNANVEGDNNTGGLVGYNGGGIVKNNYVTGTISGVKKAGGLLGRNDSATVENNHSNATVSGKEQVGGLVGYNNKGKIKYNLTTCNVYGENDTGGLVGGSFYGSISNNIALNKSVTTNSTNENFGRIIGNTYNNNKITKSNYSLDSTEFGDYNPTSNINGKDGLSKTIQDLSNQSTYEELGWDFDLNWMMVSNDEGIQAPMLQGITLKEEEIYNDGTTVKIAVYELAYIKYIKEFVNGEIKYKEEFDEDGNRIAKYTFQEVNGEKKYKYKYYYGSDEKLDYKLEYDKNGNVKSKYTYYKDDNGNYRYEFKFVYKTDGSLNYKLQYKQGSIIAKYYYYENEEDLKYKYEYDENGKLKIKYDYKNGKIIVKYLYDVNENVLDYKYIYDENENLLYKEKYNDGKLAYKYTYYKDLNGEYRYKYKDVYKSDGTIDYRYEYEAGKKVYKYTYYNGNEEDIKNKYVYKSDGSISHKYLYKSGVIAYKYTYYKDSDNIDRYKYKYYYNATGIRYTKRYDYINKKTEYISSEDELEIKEQYYSDDITFKKEYYNNYLKYLKVYKEGVLIFKLKYDSAGNLITKYTYYKDSNGNYKYDKVYYYSTKGNLSYAYEYKNSKKIAKYTFYKDDSGAYQTKYKYNYDDNGVIKYKEYYQNDIRLAKYTYYKDSKGKYRYKYKYEYDDKGTLKLKYEYKAGVKIAKYTYYKDNEGKYRYKFKYTYDSKGKLLYKEEYNLGIKIAKYTYYIDSKGKYRYKYKYMYDNGTLVFKNEYNSGKLIATYEYYKDSYGKYRYRYKSVFKSDGTINYIYEYNDGKKKYKYTFYIDDNEEYKLKYKYVYDSNEQLQYKEEYNNGIRIAKYTYYKDSRGKYRYKYKYIYDNLGEDLWKRYTYIDGKWKNKHFYMFHDPEPEIIKDTVNMNPYKVYYDDNSNLVVQFFITNGTSDHTVKGLKDIGLKLYDNDGRKIAETDDWYIDNIYLKPNHFIIINFIIPSYDIVRYDGDLEDVTFDWSFNFIY